MHRANPKSALPLARVLLPALGQGLYAGTFPVHAWTVLFKVFDAAGEVHAAAQCRRAACEWIAAALPTISDASVREAFLRSELAHPFRAEAVTTG